jgi:hypothetical protein
MYTDEGGVAFGESCFIKGQPSLEGSNLVVFYYLNASEIWSDYQRGDLWWELLY